MKKILVVGDSWSSAREEDTGMDAGWPAMLGVPYYLRQAVAGSTAGDWSRDFSGRLTLALETPCDCVVMSLLGNDALAAISDGKITLEEVTTALSAYRQVVYRLMLQHREVFVLLYANPFRGSLTKAVGVSLLNAAIMKSSPDGTKFIMTEDVLDDMDFMGGIHPVKAGWEKVGRLILRCTES